MSEALRPKQAAVFQRALRKGKIGLEEAVEICGTQGFARAILDDLVFTGHLVRAPYGGFLPVRARECDLAASRGAEVEGDAIEVRGS